MKPEGRTYCSDSKSKEKSHGHLENDVDPWENYSTAALWERRWREGSPWKHHTWWTDWSVDQLISQTVDRSIEYLCVDFVRAAGSLQEKKEMKDEIIFRREQVATGRCACWRLTWGLFWHPPDPPNIPYPELWLQLQDEGISSPQSEALANPQHWACNHVRKD